MSKKPTLNAADIQLLGKFFASKDEVNESFRELKQVISHLPTKDEFYQSQSDLVDRLVKIDEDAELLGPKVEEHALPANCNRLAKRPNRQSAQSRVTMVGRKTHQSRNPHWFSLVFKI